MLKQMEHKMNNEQISQEIRDTNLSYLMLAQRIIRHNRGDANLRLGITDDSIEMIEILSPAQIQNISKSPMLICRYQADDEMVWNLITNCTAGKKEIAPILSHPSFNMTTRFAEKV